MRIIFFVNVEDELSPPVEWLKVSLDTVELFRFLPGIRYDPDKSELLSFLVKQRDKYLFVKRILQLVILDVIIYLCLLLHVIPEIIIPIHVLLVYHVVKITGVNIESTVIIPDKETGFERGGLVLRVGRGWIPVDNGELQF